MPFIRGRYYINPTVGEAVEKAREAEEALAALQQADSDKSGADDYEWAPSAGNYDQGPIHRVEIETASLVPGHSGGAEHGFVARIHRASYPPEKARKEAPQGVASQSGTGRNASLCPETHAFSNHSDLVDFLQSELAKDAARRDSSRAR